MPPCQTLLCATPLRRLRHRHFSVRDCAADVCSRRQTGSASDREPIRWLTVHAMLLMVLSLGIAGCSQPEPPPGLLAARGVVVGNKGELVSCGGMIEFRCTTNPEQRSIGALDDEGRFELSSRTGNAKHVGALEGVYQVTIFPSGAKFIEPIVLPKAVTITPQDLEFKFAIDTSSL
jgi:hypothetical protein